MKVDCPSCSHSMELDEQLAGKLTRCAGCKQNFVVPRVVASAAVAGDELSLTTVESEKEEVEERHDPATLQFCPSCGEKWKAKSIECKKCYFNLNVNARLKPQQRQKLSLDFDIQKLFALVAIVALCYGCYWLYNNFNSVKKDANQMFDNASGTKP